MAMQAEHPYDLKRPIALIPLGDGNNIPKMVCPNLMFSGRSEQPSP
jgi:hypothetical protein